MRLPAEYLIIFAVTMEEGSVSKAASRLHLAQPTVSGHLRSLSELVGEPLYQRLHDGLVPTHTGQVLLGHAQAVARALDGAIEHIRNVRSASTGHVRLGLSSTPAAFHWPKIMTSLKHSYPQLEFQVHSGSFIDVMHNVEKRQVDVTIIAGQPQELPNGIEKLHIYQEELLLVLPPWHPWSFRGAVPVSEIEGLSLIMRQRPSSSRERIEKVLQQVQVKPRIVLELASHEAMKEAVALGLGIAFLPAPVVKRDVASGFVAALRIQGVGLERPYYLLRPPSKLLSYAAKHCVSYIIDYFKHLPSNIV